MHLVMSLLGHFVDHARAEIGDVLNRYLFSTVDTTVPGERALTANPTLQRLNLGCALMTDILVVGVIVVASLRGMFENSVQARYDLRVVMPRLIVAVALAHFSLLFMQLTIDLNNAMGHAAQSLGDQLSVDGMPWSASISAPAVDRLKVTQDVFHGLFAVALVIGVVVLALAYVVRTALLNVLVVTAPLAALLWVLPDTRSHARAWLRLFLVTVFMQAVQLIVLRVAIVEGFDHNGGLAEGLYAMATLYLMLKVPGALNTASHLETKVVTLSHHVEKSFQHLITRHPATRRKAA